MNNRLFAFLRLFLPVALLIVLGAFVYLDSGDDSRLAEIRARELLNVRLGAAMLDRRTQVIRHDLDYLARLNAIPASAKAPDRQRLENTFVELLRTKPVYDQLRWIDASGQEIVRVDLKDGQPVVVGKDKLQNKADRYYFTEAISLNSGQVYLSPLDLNVERRVIERPYKPVLRIATPLADGAGKKAGVIILNYLGDEMIAYMEAVTAQVADHLLLVNAEGYFLHAPDPADEWGFMLNDTTRSLASRFPKTWGQIGDQDHGQFRDDLGLWTFQAVYPLLLGTRGIKDIRSDEPEKISETELARHWVVVSHLPAAQLEQLLSREQGVVLLTVLVLLSLFAGGAWRMAQAAAREQRAEQRFKMYFERAMVGMAMTSPAKQWLAVNPALCRILGYPADVLVTKTWEELTYPDDLAANLVQFERVMQGEIDDYGLEKRFLRPDGQTVDTAISAQVVRKHDGSPDYFMLVVEDISARVAAEKLQQQSLETLHGFIDHLPGVAYIKDEQSRILVANRQVLDVFGVAPESLLGRSTTEIFPGEQGQRFVADDLRVLRSGQVETTDETIGERVYQTTRFPIPHDGGPSELGGIWTDVTARQQSEQMLEMQARRATALLTLPQKSVELDELSFMRHVLDLAETLTASEIGFMHFVNPDQETIELVAWSSKTLAKYCQAVVDRHYPISEAGIWAEAARQKRPVVINDYATAENKGGLPDGHSSLIRLISVPVMEEGRVRMMTGVGNKAAIYTDKDVETIQLLGNEAWRIVSRQRAERALKIAMQVVNASPVVCFRWAASAGWPVIFVSENVRQWGYRPADLQSGQIRFADIIHPDDRPRVIDEVASQTAAGGGRYEREYRIVTPENRLIWVVDRTNVQRDAAGNVQYYDGVLTDITERKNQQLALARHLGEQKELNRRLEVAHNQLLQSEKMASIGQLAAGIAHELNNPIGFVHSNLGTLDGYVRDLMEIIDAYQHFAKTVAAESPLFAQIMQLREARDFDYMRSDLTQLLLESKDGLARVRKIVLDLKGFSHVGEQQWQWADLHQGLDSTLNIVKSELKYKCEVVKEYGDLPKVNCMISQLNQVFMNLLVNAGHAIETRGVITLRTRRQGDNAVCVEVSDTGKGIAPAHLTRIFEPFFTTKPVGKGTGLGLSLAYGIVDKHHGRIEVDSTLGQGTTFRVILPINQEAGAAGANPEAFV